MYETMYLHLCSKVFTASDMAESRDVRVIKTWLSAKRVSNICYRVKTFVEEGAKPINADSAKSSTTTFSTGNNVQLPLGYHLSEISMAILVRYQRIFNHNKSLLSP